MTDNFQAISDDLSVHVDCMWAYGRNSSISFECDIAIEATFKEGKVFSFYPVDRPIMLQESDLCTKFNNIQLLASVGDKDLGIEQECLIVPSGHDTLDLSCTIDCVVFESVSIDGSITFSDRIVKNFNEFDYSAAVVCDIENPSRYCKLSTLDDSHFVILPSPEFGNTETFDTGSIPRISYNGDQIQVRKKNRIVLTSYSFSFRVDDIKDLIIFLYNTLGEKVKLITHTGETIEGIVETDPATIGNMVDFDLVIRGYRVWE